MSYKIFLKTGPFKWLPGVFFFISSYKTYFMQYFITKSNFMRITRKFNIELENMNDPVYKNPIYFFSDIEKHRILSVKQFLIHSKDELVKFSGSGYIPDSYNFIYEQSRHAKYHRNSQCEKLNSSYSDIEIPVEIKFKAGTGKLDIERINKFREWFKQPEIFDLYKTDQTRFIEKLQVKFQLVNPPKPVEFSNGGIKQVSTFSEQELENKIDELIKLASSFYSQSDINREILVKNNFSKKTYYVTSAKYKDVKLYIAEKSYSNNEIRQVITEFNSKIKKPLIDFLIDYWILKLNPKLDFSGNILEKLDFKSCSSCSHQKCIYNAELDILDKDDEWELASEYSNSQQIIAKEIITDNLPF